jgi:hypothetical protein
MNESINQCCVKIHSNIPLPTTPRYFEWCNVIIINDRPGLKERTQDNISVFQTPSCLTGLWCGAGYLHTQCNWRRGQTHLIYERQTTMRNFIHLNNYTIHEWATNSMKWVWPGVFGFTVTADETRAMLATIQSRICRFPVSCPDVQNYNFTCLFVKVKVKVKLSLRLTKHRAMKTYWESGGTAPLILWPRH